MSARERGKQIEDKACHFLKQKGLQLVTRNYHCRGGEIDLIMLQQQTLVFVEVRFRSGHAFGDAVESVNRQKQARIIHTASHFLQQYAKPYAACRFDVVAVSPAGQRYDFQWLKDAFQSG